MTHPCLSLSPDQQTVFHTLLRGRKRNQEYGVSKYDTDALAQITSLARELVRGVLEDLADEDLVHIEDGRVWIDKYCTCELSRAEPETDLSPKRRVIRRPTTSSTPLSSSTQQQTGIPARLRPAAQALDSHQPAAVKSYGRAKVGRIGQWAPTSATVMRASRENTPPEKWSTMQLATYFGSAAGCRQRPQSTNFKALARTFALWQRVDGVTSITIKMMIDLFAARTTHRITKPLWQIFISQRCDLLVEAEQRLSNKVDRRGTDVTKDLAWQRWQQARSKTQTQAVTQ